MMMMMMVVVMITTNLRPNIHLHRYNLVEKSYEGFDPTVVVYSLEHRAIFSIIEKIHYLTFLFQPTNQLRFFSI